ncbi:cupin domain-containing protein [Candidatus Thorarchaeota archaeon]|nr:MAG: cupin domain-containing protein [Candidatus Thorarchaeota archaeon]
MEMIVLRRINEKDIKGKVVRGLTGYVDAFDVISHSPTIGIRVVAPNSEVPERVHAHPERQVMYLISGEAMLTNRVSTIELQPGDFAVLEPNEEHYLITRSGEAKLFEVKF